MHNAFTQQSEESGQASPVMGSAADAGAGDKTRIGAARHEMAIGASPLETRVPAEFAGDGSAFLRCMVNSEGLFDNDKIHAWT